MKRLAFLAFGLVACSADQFSSNDDAGGDATAFDAATPDAGAVDARADADVDAGPTSPCAITGFLFCDDFDNGTFGAKWLKNVATPGLTISASAANPYTAPSSANALGTAGVTDGFAKLETTLQASGATIAFAFAARIPTAPPGAHFGIAQLALGNLTLTLELQPTKLLALTSQVTPDPVQPCGNVRPQADDGQWHRYAIRIPRTYTSKVNGTVTVSVDGVDLAPFTITGAITTSAPQTVTIGVGLPFVEAGKAGGAFVDDVVVREN